MASSATPTQELPKNELVAAPEELRKRIIVSVLAIIGGFLACLVEGRPDLRIHAASHHQGADGAIILIRN